MVSLDPFKGDDKAVPRSICHASPLLVSFHAVQAYLPGASGTGRTTFVNTLVDQSLLDHRAHSLLSDPSNPHSNINIAAVREAAAQAHVEPQIRIKPLNVELDEDGVRIALTIVDTPGFGDGVDNEYWSVVFHSYRCR